jgi:hypothetical protein
VDLANLFLPSTIDGCFDHSGEGSVPGIKSDNGDWDTRSHANRLVFVNQELLITLAKIYDADNTPSLETRLPAIHSQQIAAVLAKLATTEDRLEYLARNVFFTECWHETNRERDGTIRRLTDFRRSGRQLVISGPHFFAANPYYKTPEQHAQKKPLRCNRFNRSPRRLFSTHKFFPGM